MADRAPHLDPAAALGAVNAWRADPGAAVSCPACGVSGLAVTDRSVRPYAEWYHLACPACGLDHTLHLAMPRPMADD